MTCGARTHGKSNGAVALFVVLGAGILLALLVATLAYAPPADAAPNRRAVSDARSGTGFPLWYQDAKGLRLKLCLAGPPLCLARGRGLRPPAGEAFWWSAEAQMERIGLGRSGQARLVLAVEAAFANRRPRSKIAFGRIRVRVDNLNRRTVYKITHPYGVIKARTDGEGELRVSRDVGAGAPRKFSRALRSPVFRRFLRWKSGAPRGFIGNPNVPHRVIGSPRGTNFFLIEGPNVGGRGDRSRRTERFLVQGKVA